ncbi:MAG: type VI secretion system tip protein VgrG [Bacteroidaceae bacterium]|nr:type VI secretion system tip protein VgrG [Bacteroidaceae bacterium]
MADSPSKNKDRVLTCFVYANGKKLGDTYNLVSATVCLELNRIGRAMLKFNAGNQDKQTFDESDENTFSPGSAIRLDAGDINNQETIFDGIIVGLRIQTDSDFRSYMVLECRDAAFAATQGRKNRIFEKKTDSEIINETLSSYGSVAVDSTQYKHSSLVQYYCSDWDFALSRADACGLYISCDGGKINIKKPKVDGSPVHTLTFGEDIIAFNLELSSDEQYSHYKAVSWSPDEQKMVATSASNPKFNKQGDLNPDKIAVGNDMLLQTDAPTEDAALKQWAESMALKAALARYQGFVSFYGSSKVVPGCLIELKGLGKRFNGNMFVGSVIHTIKNNEWVTEAGAGVSHINITEEPDVMSPSASGFLPGMQGLHSGIVRKLDGDPLNQYRVQVELPWMDGQNKLLWVRLVSLYATKESSIFFLPEIGDEVLVGFMNNDPSHPVALGGFYSTKQKPPYEFDAKNNKKAIVTRAKLSVEFDEEKKIITLKTPGGNTMELSDDGKCIHLADQHKNEITMNDSGISLSSNKDIILKAKNSITMDATSKISITSKSDVGIDGMNANIQAKVGATVKGNATAELSASGQTTVKGAMVMIN